MAVIARCCVITANSRAGLQLPSSLRSAAIWLSYSGPPLLSLALAFVSFSLHALALLLPHTFSQASDSELVFAPRLVRWFAGLLSFSFDGASLQARVCTITAGPEYVPKTTCISQRTTFRPPWLSTLLVLLRLDYLIVALDKLFISTTLDNTRV